MATVTVSIRGDKHFQRRLKGLDGKVNRVCQQSINRTLQRSRTQMTNAIGTKLNLKKKTIRDLTSIQRATKLTGLIGKLSVKHKPVPLIEYKAKQNRKGVSFKVFHDKPRQLIKSAFIYPDKRGRLTVFRREPEAGRLKIKPLYGTTVTNVAQDRLLSVIERVKYFYCSEVLRLLSILE